MTEILSRDLWVDAWRQAQRTSELRRSQAERPHAWSAFFPERPRAEIEAAVDSVLAPFVRHGRCQAEGRDGAAVVWWPSSRDCGETA